MDLRYIQDCPSCGAPIELVEIDRVVMCSYCDNSNYLVSGNTFRFVLPEKIPEDIDTTQYIYIPYLRFKGHIYSCRGRTFSQKIMDTTQLGISSDALPTSLGLRPQAMAIALAGRNMNGQFLRLTQKVSTIFSKASQLTDAFAADHDEVLFHRSFIGESISYIYLPAYIKDGAIFDGITLQRIGMQEIVEPFLGKAVSFAPRWLPRFIATHCPRCGAAMESESDSLVMVCRNCGSLWQEVEGRFEQVSATVWGENVDLQYYLPFWVIEPEITGGELASFGDFLRVTNHPVVILRSHDEQVLRFIIPAFKIRPKYFLKLAKNLTISQEKLGGRRECLPIRMHPVTLPVQEAAQAIKAVMAYCVMNKRSFFPLLPQMNVSVRRLSLCYLPFNERGQDWVEKNIGIAIPKTVLRYGRSM